MIIYRRPHKFRADKTAAPSRGWESKVPPLTRNLFIIVIFLGKKSVFSSEVSLGIFYQEYLVNTKQNPRTHFHLYTFHCFIGGFGFLLLLLFLIRFLLVCSELHFVVVLFCFFLRFLFDCLFFERNRALSWVNAG